MADDAPGSIYATRITARLAEERERRASLYTRAIAVVSTSGVIVSLLFGLENASGTGLAQLTWQQRLLLGLAIGAFLLAAGTALLIVVPKTTQYRPNASGMKDHVQQWSNGDKDKEEKNLAELDAANLIGFEAKNDKAFIWLLVAVIVEIVGIALVAVVAVLLLIDPSTGA